MAKFAVLFFAALAFQAVLAGPFDYDQQNPNLRTLKKRIQEVSHDAVESIENIQSGDYESAKTLALQANEYAHDVNDAVFHLYQIVLQVQRGQTQELLDKVAHVLSDYAHAVHQAITEEPSELKSVLKQNILGVNYQIERLTQIAQQQQHQVEQGEDSVTHQVQSVFEELLDAIHQFQFRGQVQHETHYETKGNIQEYVQRISTIIQRISTYDNKTAHELAHQAHELSHLVGHIIHHLFKELHHQGADDNAVFQQILNKLGEIRVTLDQLIKSHGSNVQVRVDELKNQLRTNVHSFAVQVERLVQVAQHGDHEVSNLIKYVVSDVLTGFQHLYRNLEQLAQNQYHEKY